MMPYSVRDFGLLQDNRCWWLENISLTSRATMPIGASETSVDYPSISSPLSQTARGYHTQAVKSNRRFQVPSLRAFSQRVGNFPQSSAFIRPFCALLSPALFLL